MKKNTSKRYKKLLDSAKEKKVETIDEAIKKVKKNCTSKFDESIDVSFFLNLKNKKDEANLRTVVNLPNGNGKKVKVAVLCEEGKVKEHRDYFDFCSGTFNNIPVIGAFFRWLYSRFVN